VLSSDFQKSQSRIGALEETYRKLDKLVTDKSHKTEQEQQKLEKQMEQLKQQQSTLSNDINLFKKRDDHNQKSIGTNRKTNH